MRILTGEEWVDVTVFEPGTDPYGPHVIDSPVGDLTSRTGYLKARLSGTYLWLPYYFSGDTPQLGEAVCMGASNNEIVTRAVAAALAQAGLPLGIVCGTADGSIVPVAIAGLIPYTITGLGSGTAGELVRVNTADATALRGTDAGTNYILGRANLGGTLQLIPDQYVVAA